MYAVWQTVTRSVTKIRTASFTTVLVASILLPLIAGPNLAHAGGINNTRGDAWGTQEVAASGWLNGAGVTIYSNGSQVFYTPNKPNNTVNGVVSGEEWQCVELVNRLYLTKGWTTATWTGNGGQLYDNAPAGLTKELNGAITYLNPGDTLVLQDSSAGHGAIINSYNSSTGAIQIASQNTNVVFDTTFSLNNKTISSTGWGTYTVKGIVHHPNTSSDNTVLQVKKLTQADGTNEVVWSKGTDVSESWWRNGSGITVSNLIHISQGDIKSFDIALSSDNKHDLFTATTNNIWETWWYPGQGLHTSEILQNIGNIRKIIKSVGPDGVTQQLYVMTDTGVYEYWWNANSNGIQHDTIMTLANPVDEYKALEPDGTQALYVADQNYPYEQHWGPGITGLQQTTFSSVAGITSISFSEGGANNKHRLYIGASSGAIWEASWLPNGTVGYWYMTGGSPVVALQKWEDDSTQVIYEATAGGVYEYYWPTTSNTLSGDTIVGLSNVHAFVRSTDPGGVQSVYTATGTNIDESWWLPGGDGIHTGQIE